MKFTPRPWQTPMIQHMLGHKRCGVWAGMGLGKTTAALTAIDAINMVDPGPTLVLAPKRVARSTWPAEAAKWDHLKHLRISPVLGTPAQRMQALRRPADIYPINYDNLMWLTEVYNEEWPFTKVVADEATKLKSFRLQQGGKRTRALGKIAFSKIDRFIELTGTPSPNGIKDLWGQAWFLDRGQRLGRSYTAFQERWFYQDWGVTEYRQMYPHAHAQAEVQDLLSDICLSIEAKDYFDIEEPITQKIYVKLPPAARAAYNAMEEEFFAEIEGKEIEAVHAGAKSQKLLQMANGAAYIDDKGNWVHVHDEKLDALEEIYEEAAGAPLLVAYTFKSDVARIMKRFPKARILDDKQKTEDDWNAGKIGMLLAHPASAGHGINLQDGGNILVRFGLNWNLELHLQILERIGPTRQMQSGHERPVFDYCIMAEDTLDDDVYDRLDGKGTVQQILMEALKRRGNRK